MDIAEEKQPTEADAPSNPKTKRDRRSVALMIFMGFMKIAYLYMAVTFFRLDWVEYEDVERSWQVMSMKCQAQPAAAIISIYQRNSEQPDYPLHFSKMLYDHLSAQPSGTINVRQKVIGYLPEWNYGIFVPQSIAGRTVQDTWLISREITENCTFVADENAVAGVLGPKLLRLRERETEP